MAEETVFENERISNFQGLVTLTLDRVILHQSSTSTYMPNVVEINETLWMYGWTELEIHFIRSTPTSDLKTTTALLSGINYTISSPNHIHHHSVLYFTQMAAHCPTFTAS